MKRSRARVRLVTRSFAVLIACLVSRGVLAQPLAPNPNGCPPRDGDTVPSSSRSAAANVVAGGQARADAPPPPRWFRLQTASLSMRYRFVENSEGVTTAEHLQYSLGLKGAFTFDARGRVSLVGAGFTGGGFTSGWNSSGIGTGSAAGDFSLKQLYLAVVPVSGLELTYGAIPVVRGEATEATTWDNDGYLTGGRATLNRRDLAFFDEITISLAWLGDLATPGIQDRVDHLGEVNYQQYLVARKLGARAAVSVDATRHAGTDTLREAITVKTAETRLVDSVRLEAYQALDGANEAGYLVHGDRRLARRLALGAGFADVDPRFGTLNGDRFGKGRRLYATATVGLPRAFSVQAFVTRAVGNSMAIANRTRVDIILTYDALKALQPRLSF